MDEFTEYVASLDDSVRDAVEHVRARARQLVPEAEEGMSYGMAAFALSGQPAGVGAGHGEAHRAVSVQSAPAIEALAPNLAGFSTSKGTIRFTPEQPLPDEVLDRLILFRRDEIDAMRSR